MIKGCAKRVVVVRDMDSQLFEEAFFIVRPGSRSKGSEDECISEARRIMHSNPPLISADSAVQTALSKKSISMPLKTKSSIVRDALMFIMGFGVSAVLCTLIYYTGMWL